MEEQGQVFVERSPRIERSAGSRILGLFLRFFFVTLVGIAIGVGAYYGIPALYKDFIQPVQINTQRVAELEESLAQLQVDFLEKQSSLSTSFAKVEGEVAGQHEDLAVLQAQGQGLETRMDEVQSELEGVQSLSDRLRETEESLEDLGKRLGALEAALEEEDPPIEQIQRQIELLRVMELVTRARLWLIQDNLGKAVDDLAIAKEILENLNADAQEDEVIMPIIERLDQILFEIPLSPVIAADDLEIVWQYLILATAP
ncbi:MAG: hypothetical protein A2Z14_00680 [Chloroflexi bacterium RBG_16_48_8]|nr:MAG: hypothetical protein A2Z14_00680 [Chloroflexi bacterium RBG_16_48_8]